MIILAIETTSSAASVALVDGEKLIGEYSINAKLSHLEKLMPMIHSLLQNSQIKLDDVNAVAISEGPGSFTGIRIGASAAKTLAQVKNIPIISVPTLRALCYNLMHYQGVICPILDARRSQVYGGAYKWENGELTEIVAGMAYTISEMIEAVKSRSTEENIIFLGDGILPYKEEIIKELGNRAKFAVQSVRSQRASSVAQLGYEMMEKGQSQKYNDMKPNYMRKSEAERNLEKIKKEQ